ncbi:protein CNGC15b-like [Rhododendron vialii]|uniref:protein CNGC15b-like n=1 Tax=Rhododendron vialii TaxID=182163 RepID=UPI00265E1073|nr:protein CNGC15b-like [Rhododendron vialii]XP_058221913.1 protein CNGC15b-like [Rhododendron vialii]
MALRTAKSYKRLHYSASEPETPTKQDDTIQFRCNGILVKSEVLSKFFAEDFKKVKQLKMPIDPRSRFVNCWSRIFLAACLVSMFVDPLFLYMPMVQPADRLCLENSVNLGRFLTSIRSMTDLFFVAKVLVRFRTAYVSPSSCVFGAGELVVDPWKIALRYITTKGFWFDIAAAIPIPQVLIMGIIPHLGASKISDVRISLVFLMMIQYLQRLIIASPLTMEIAKATGVIIQASWIGAAYNLTLYLLSSHVMGSCMYLLTVQRKAACWRSVCSQDNSTCNESFFDCSSIGSPIRNQWIQSSNISNLCSPSGNYPFGIYGPGLASGVTTGTFLQRYFYSLWSGLKSVSTLGQNFVTSIFVGENIFATVIVLVGLLNLALLVGNMQRYLQSSSTRLEEWRVTKKAKEQWMHHRQLPKKLRQGVRRYDQYKWVATQGVDEASLLKELPKHLRRQIKRQLCLNLVRRVPFFVEMDDRLLDSICERLKPTLWPAGMFIVREGDPLEEMLFIIRGHLDSYTTNGGRTGFFNSCQIQPGDFCGEELLTWALEPRPSDTLPSSTRTVKATSDAEAFALGADDLKFVASQFRKLHSKQLRHKLRFHSHQWRMWAACFIQAAWRRHKKRKELAELLSAQGGGHFLQMDMLVPQPGAGALSLLPKPEDPDFCADDDST